MLQNDSGPLFPLGKITLTPGAKESLRGRDLLDAILGHMRGLSDVFTSDGNQFLFAQFSLTGSRVIGTYRATNGRKFLVVTEADRSRTTVMLAEEFSHHATA